MDNPHYNDTYYPENFELPLYLLDEYQSYDICYIHAVNPYILSSVMAIWDYWFYDQLLLKIVRTNFNYYESYSIEYKFTLIDRYVPDNYEYAEDYGKKIFDIYTKWSGSKIYEIPHISGKNNVGSYGNLQNYNYTIPYSDFMKVFDPYNIQFTIPKNEYNTDNFTLTYYYKINSDRANFCINKAYKTFYLSKESKQVALESDYEIQICSIIVNCTDNDLKNHIETQLNNISYLLLYKQLDTLLGNIDIFLINQFTNVFKVWVANGVNFIFTWNDATTNIDITRHITSNQYSNLPLTLQVNLQKWFYLHPKVNPWGNLKTNDTIKGDLYWFTDNYEYQKINGIWTLIELPNPSLGFSMIPRYNYPTNASNQIGNYNNNIYKFNPIYCDLILWEHIYPNDFNTTKINTIVAIVGNVFNTPSFNYPLSWFSDQLVNPPQTYNGIYRSSLTFDTNRFYTANIRPSNYGNAENFFYDYIFSPCGLNDFIIVAWKMGYYFGYSVTYKYINYKIWIVTKTIDDIGYVTDNLQEVKSGTHIINSSNPNYAITNYITIGERIFNNTIDDRIDLFANEQIFYFTYNEVTDFIKNKYYLTNEFLTTGETSMPDSVRIKELHNYTREIRDALYADKFAYEDPEDPDNENRRIANLGYYIERIARVLGISVNPDGSIRMIRQSKHIKQGDEIPAGWVIGQWGRNQGANKDGGQEKGNENEDRDGLAYEVRTNKFTTNVFTGQADKIEQGGYVLVENLPQLLHIILDDFDKALGMAEAGANVLPSPNNSKPIPYEGINTLLAEVAYMISQLSRNITGTHINSLKNQGMLMELIAAHGTPSALRVMKVDLGVEDAELSYPGIEGMTNYQMTTWILSQLAFILGASLKEVPPPPTPPQPEVVLM